MSDYSQLINLIRSNKVIKSIDLRHNYINEEILKEMKSALTENISLIRIDIDQADWHYDELELIEEIRS